MRVLHVSAYFAPAFGYGGPPRSILGLCQALRRIGVDAEVLTTTANGDRELEPGKREHQGVPVEYLPRSFPKRHFNATGLARRLRELPPNFDLVHVHGLWNFTTWGACSVARRLKKPYVISPRGMLDVGSMQRKAMLKRWVFRLKERRNLAEAAILHATSQEEADNISRVEISTLVRLIPNGVEIIEPNMDGGRDLRRRLAIAPADPVVVYLGRIARLKRLDLLAQAFEIARETHPNAKLVIAGPDENGHRTAIQPHFASCGDAVRFLGEIDAEKKRSLFGAANVLVCCSDSESFGLSVAEALGAGVPAVATKTCPWRVLQQVDAGRWVDQRPPAIAQGIVEVLIDPAKARQMGERGRKLIRDEFSWEGVGQRMVALYREALGLRDGSP